MVEIEQVGSLDAAARFCELTDGTARLTPNQLPETQADAHLLLHKDGHPLARCSLWWSRTPELAGQRVGMLGHYSAREGQHAQALLDFACAELARQGCQLAVGPIDGGTHQRYRLVTERGQEPPFLLEPQNPDDWPAHFTGSGFTPLANYYSALQTSVERADSRAPELIRQFAEHELVIRELDLTRFEQELHRIYRVVAASFQHNFLASPLAEADFLAQYLPLRPYIQPQLVRLAECAGQPAGFLFALPDWLQAERHERINTLIVKTLAVHPAWHGKGLATLLAASLEEPVHALGYTRIIHALMHETNVSRRVSQTNHGQIMRRYTLYARPLEKVLCEE